MTGTGPRRGTGLDPMLRAATRAFAERGYHGSSIRDLARDSGRSVAALYHHVAGKQELLAMIVDELMLDLITRTRLARDLAPADDHAERLRQITGAHVRFHAERREGAFVAATEFRSLDPAHRRRYDDLRRSQQDLFHDVIDDGVRAGVFTTDLPNDASRAIVSMGVYVAFWYRPEGDLTPSELADRYASMALTLVGHGPDPATAPPG